MRKRPIPTQPDIAPAVAMPIATACDVCPRPCLTGSARLVGIGFRCWLSGYQTGDIACWEQAWDAYAGALGPERAKVAVTELACWVRTISRTAQRPIEVYPGPCATFCRDECMAVSMVAASQNSICPALRACAFALLESSDVNAVVTGAQVFADALRGIDVLLPPDAVFPAVANIGGAGAYVSTRAH
jgi:hypothetical protein